MPLPTRGRQWRILGAIQSRRFHQNGRGGLTANDREAARLYKLAADQGNANAQNNLGTFYRDGRGGLEKDDREAARLYRLAADQGNVFAEVGLGFFYETGRGGLPKDDRQLLASINVPRSKVMPQARTISAVSI